MITLNDFRQAALEAANGQNGLDSVIQFDKADGTLGCKKCQVLGSRSKEFKDMNLDTRRELMAALNRELSDISLDKLPKSVKEALKIGDFKIKNGVITSNKPLTARRILCLTDALMLDENAAKIHDELQKFENKGMLTKFDRIVMSKMAYVDKNDVNGKFATFDNVGNLKTWHLKVAADLVGLCRESKLSFSVLGGKCYKLNSFVNKFSKIAQDVIGKMLLDINGNGTRYGKHEVGKEDNMIILETALKTLMKTDPRIKKGLQNVGKNDLVEMSDDAADDLQYEITNDNRDETGMTQEEQYNSQYKIRLCARVNDTYEVLKAILDQINAK